MLKERVPRETVYISLNAERDYQEIKWPGHRHSIEEYMVYMMYYMDEAKRVISTGDYTEVTNPALDIIRKITALGVSCMEDNGVTWRKNPDAKVKGYHGS